MTNVFEAVSQRLGRIPDVVYASSAAVYYEADPYPRPRPTGRTTPATLYGVSKLADEGMARVYAPTTGCRRSGCAPTSSTAPGATRA